MPSFDITCEVDRNEVKNALNQVRKELGTRFDFRGVPWEIVEEKNTITLSTASEHKLAAILDIVRDRMARRSVSPKNIEEGRAETSSTGRARQVLTLREGIPAEHARTLVAAVRASELKLQAAIEAGKVRVSGKKRDDLQEIIARVRLMDLPITVGFGNFRE